MMTPVLMLLLLVIMDVVMVVCVAGFLVVVDVGVFNIFAVFFSSLFEGWWHPIQNEENCYYLFVKVCIEESGFVNTYMCICMHGKTNRKNASFNGSIIGSIRIRLF